MAQKNTLQTGFYLDHGVLGLPRQGQKELDSMVKMADWRTLTAQLSCFSTIDVDHRFFNGESADMESRMAANAQRAISIREGLGEQLLTWDRKFGLGLPPFLWDRCTRAKAGVLAISVMTAFA